MRSRRRDIQLWWKEPGAILLIGLVGAIPVMIAGACGMVDTGDVADDEVASYPNHPISLVSWVTPGGPTDLLARAIAKFGPARFGQRIDVLTKRGGGGAVAMQYLLSQQPDGHTLAIFTSSGVVTIAAARAPFRLDQFSYIVCIQRDPFVIAVRSDSPLQSLRELFTYAEDNPGHLAVSGFGTASAHFLAFQRLRAAAGNPDVRWIAYEGSADAAVAALGGHTDAVNTNYNVVREHLRAGAMRILAASTRLPRLPQVPSYQDSGYDVAPVHWRGLVGPPGMKPERIQSIRALMRQTLAGPEFEQFMEQSGTEYGMLESSEAFAAQVKSELETTQKLMRELGLLRDQGF